MDTTTIGPNDIQDNPFIFKDGMLHNLNDFIYLQTECDKNSPAYHIDICVSMHI